MSSPGSPPKPAPGDPARAAGCPLAARPGGRRRQAIHIALTVLVIAAIAFMRVWYSVSADIRRNHHGERLDKAAYSRAWKQAVADRGGYLNILTGGAAPKPPLQDSGIR